LLIASVVVAIIVVLFSFWNHQKPSKASFLLEPTNALQQIYRHPRLTYPFGLNEYRLSAQPNSLKDFVDLFLLEMAIMTGIDLS
jgi:hypothetical protein